MHDSEAKLDWSMSLADGALRVSYRVMNTSDKAIHVADGLLVRGKVPHTYARAEGRLVVMNGDAPGEVKLTLGSISADELRYSIPPPTFRPLAPGQVLAAEVLLPLPLKSWHNVGVTDELDPEPTKARLVIHYFSHDPEWTTVPSDDGGQIQVPKSYRGGFATTEPKSIPIPER